MNRLGWKTAACAIAAFAALEAVTVAAPTTVPYVGYLTRDSGEPFSGVVQVSAALFDDAMGNSPIWGPQSMGTLSVQGGALAFTLGGLGAQELDSALLSQELFLEISLDGEPLTPRQLVHTVPYALRAADTDHLAGHPATAFTLAANLAAVASSGDVANLGGDPTQGVLAATFAQRGGDTLTGDLDFGFGRLLDARMRVEPSPPAPCQEATAGLFYLDSSLGALRVCDGSQWVAWQTGACALPWGGELANGQSVTAYASASVACGSSCQSETRLCAAGVLSGSYTHASCSVAACSGCTLPWGGSVSHGASVTAYSSSSVPCNSTCSIQTRTCSDGSLSGSYTHSSCSVDACSNECPYSYPPETLYCQCSASATQSGSLWGTNIYTNDSSICRAAVHAGRIGFGGGWVTVVPSPGLSSYTGSTQNGVTSSSWGSWSGSFYFQ